MGQMMADKVKETPQFWPIDMVVPVPMSSSGVRKRGFNQSELLSARITKLLKLRHDPRVLIRVKETPPQRELSRQEREKNLKDAFAIKDPKHIQGKNVLLVDDVYTTGSTVKECTNALLKAGAARVGVISWAAGKGF
ncbi:MAG: ComF family protein [Ignavibacteriales bacterium]